MYVTSDDGTQKMFFFCQPSFNTLELKKAKALIMFLVGNQKGSLLLNVNHYLILFCIT